MKYSYSLSNTLLRHGHALFHPDSLISKPAWVQVEVFIINSFTRSKIVQLKEIEELIHGPIGKSLQTTSYRNATHKGFCPTLFHKVLLSTISASTRDTVPSPIQVQSDDHAMIIATSLGAAFGDASLNSSSTSDRLRSAQTLFCSNVSITSQTRFVVLTIHSSSSPTPKQTFPLRHA